MRLNRAVCLCRGGVGSDGVHDILSGSDLELD